MLKSRMLCLTLFSSALCLPSFAVAPAIAEQPVRVQIGEKSTKTHHHRHRCQAKHPKCQEKCTVKSLLYRSYRPTYYVKGVGVDGETLTMNDETVFVIANNSMATVASWTQNSPIVISPSRWYSQYSYYITNTLTHETATAKLSQGPLVKYAIFIQQIDWNSGYVYLSNGTQWTIRSSNNMRPWQAGQAVLIGQNAWLTGYILVNVNEDNYLESSYLR